MIHEEKNQIISCKFKIICYAGGNFFMVILMRFKYFSLVAALLTTTNLSFAMDVSSSSEEEVPSGQHLATLKIDSPQHTGINIDEYQGDEAIQFNTIKNGIKYRIETHYLYGNPHKSLIFMLNTYLQDSGRVMKSRALLSIFREIFEDFPERIPDFASSLQGLPSDANLLQSLFLDALRLNREKGIAPSLDLQMIEELSLRYFSNYIAHSQRKEDLQEAIWYSILGSSKNQNIFDRLSHDILHHPGACQICCDFFLPLFIHNNPEAARMAHELFSMLCLKSKDFFEYVQERVTMINPLEQPSDEASILAILFTGLIEKKPAYERQLKENEDNDEYNSIMQDLWAVGPHDAICRLRELEKSGGLKAKVKLEELRAVKKPQPGSHAALLQERDKSDAQLDFQVFKINFIDEYNSASFKYDEVKAREDAESLLKAVHGKHPSAIRFAKDQVEKSMGYKNAKKLTSHKETQKKSITTKSQPRPIDRLGQAYYKLQNTPITVPEVKKGEGAAPQAPQKARSSVAANSNKSSLKATPKQISGSTNVPLQDPWTKAIHQYLEDNDETLKGFAHLVDEVSIVSKFDQEKGQLVCKRNLPDHVVPLFYEKLSQLSDAECQKRLHFFARRSHIFCQKEEFLNTEPLQEGMLLLMEFFQQKKQIAFKLNSEILKSIANFYHWTYVAKQNDDHLKLIIWYSMVSAIQGDQDAYDILCSTVTGRRYGGTAYKIFFTYLFENFFKDEKDKEKAAALVVKIIREEPETLNRMTDYSTTLASGASASEQLEHIKYVKGVFGETLYQNSLSTWKSPVASINTLHMAAGCGHKGAEKILNKERQSAAYNVSNGEYTHGAVLRIMDKKGDYSLFECLYANKSPREQQALSSAEVRRAALLLHTLAVNRDPKALQYVEKLKKSKDYKKLQKPASSPKSSGSNLAVEYHRLEQKLGTPSLQASKPTDQKKAEVGETIIKKTQQATPQSPDCIENPAPSVIGTTENTSSLAAIETQHGNAGHQQNEDQKNIKKSSFFSESVPADLSISGEASVQESEQKRDQKEQGKFASLFGESTNPTPEEEAAALKKLQEDVARAVKEGKKSFQSTSLLDAGGHGPDKQDPTPLGKTEQENPSGLFGDSTRENAALQGVRWLAKKGDPHARKTLNDAGLNPPSVENGRKQDSTQISGAVSKDKDTRGKKDETPGKGAPADTRSNKPSKTIRRTVQQGVKILQTGLGEFVKNSGNTAAQSYLNRKTFSTGLGAASYKSLGGANHGTTTSRRGSLSTGSEKAPSVDDKSKKSRSGSVSSRESGDTSSSETKPKKPSTPRQSKNPNREMDALKAAQKAEKLKAAQELKDHRVIVHREIPPLSPEDMRNIAYITRRPDLAERAHAVSRKLGPITGLTYTEACKSLKKINFGKPRNREGTGHKELYYTVYLDNGSTEEHSLSLTSDMDKIMPRGFCDDIMGVIEKAQIDLDKLRIKGENPQ